MPEDHFIAGFLMGQWIMYCRLGTLYKKGTPDSVTEYRKGLLNLIGMSNETPRNGTHGHKWAHLRGVTGSG